MTGEPLGTDENSRTPTDKDGKFSVSITGEWGPILSIHLPEYWNYTYIPPGGGWSTGSKAYDSGSVNENEILKLKAMAWFGGVLHFNLIPDSIEFTDLYEDLGLTGSSGRKYYNKKIIDFYDRKYLAVGNDYFRYFIKYKSDGIWHEMIDSVYVQKGEIYHDTLYF